jgi:hypothetical protein|nr:MAG TPA: replication protein O [Caudoviricetes sp.]DAW33910.1 MAG TPA: replication protein O [Caudoviricetes sp.]
MANNRNTYQQIQTVSVSRERLLDMATNVDYNKKDFRVFLALLTQLDGYTVPKKLNKDHQDPLNFKKIDKEALADLLCLSKKEVNKAIDKLYEDGYIEKGDNQTIKNGYRFTF